MSGTQATQWEGHLAEVMWRSEVKGHRYQAFFDLLRSVYTLEGPPEYKYTTPLFDSWPGPVVSNIGNWTLQPELTDASSDERSFTGEDHVGAIGVDEPAVSVPLGSEDNPLHTCTKTLFQLTKDRGLNED
jgi:hypothetical protein